MALAAEIGQRRGSRFFKISSTTAAYDLNEKGGIASDPNRPDDEQYIVRLLGQVITVSLETLRVVNALPPVET